MSWLCSKGALNEDTSILYCLSSGCICEVYGVPPVGMVCMLSLLSATVSLFFSSRNSCSDREFNLCLSTYIWSIGTVEGVASSQLLLGFFSLFRGV